MKRGREVLWVAILAAAYALWALAPPEPGAQDNVVQARVRPTSSAARRVMADPAPTSAAAGTAMLRMHPRTELLADADAMLWLSVKPGAPPAPTPVRPQPAPDATTPVPATPATPEPPFRVLGRYGDTSREGVVLVQADGSVLLAQAGDTLTPAWRVESLTGNVLILNYLPLQQRLTLDAGIAK